MTHIHQALTYLSKSLIFEPWDTDKDLHKVATESPAVGYGERV
jgi:hypothetical protein